MPCVQTPEAFDLLTADGTTTGYAPVADNSLYYPGATVWLRSAGAGSAECVVTDLSGLNRVGLRIKTNKGKGRSDVSAWTLVGVSSIGQEKQVVQVNAPSDKLLSA